MAMRRRSKSSSKQANARSRKTVKRRTTSKDVRRPSSSARPKIGTAQLARERDEALEQLSGASEVLKVIGSSSGDLKPVFQTIGHIKAGRLRPLGVTTTRRLDVLPDIRDCWCQHRA